MANEAVPGFCHFFTLAPCDFSSYVYLRLMSNKTFSIPVTYNVKTAQVTVTSPKTGLMLWLPVGTSWDGETANGLVRKIMSACTQVASQFGKNYTSGGTSIRLTREELLTFKTAYNDMINHFAS